MALCRIILLIICLCLATGLAMAQESMPTESGFSGYIEILGAYISTNSQLNTGSGNKRTDSLDSSGDRTGKFRPFPLGLIRYTFAEKRTQLYLGVLPENVVQGQFQIEAGVRHVLKKRHRPASIRHSRNTDRAGDLGRSVCRRPKP